MVGFTNPGDLAGAFADAWNRHDMKEFASLFTDDANFVNVVGMWWKSREEIEKAHTATHSNMFRNSRLESKVASIAFIRSDVMGVHAAWELTGATSPDGAPSETRKGILLLVVVEEETGWRIKIAQNTDIVPGVPAHTANMAR